MRATKTIQPKFYGTYMHTINILACAALCFSVHISKSMEEKQRVNYFDYLPPERVEDIVVYAGRDSRRACGIDPYKYADIACVDKRFNGIVDTTGFARRINHLGSRVLHPAANYYYKVNEAIGETLVWGIKESTKDRLKQKFIALKNDSSTAQYVDPNFVMCVNFGGGHTLLTLGINTDDLGIVRYLLKNGSDPNFAIPSSIVNPVRGYPIQLACTRAVLSSGSEGSIQICDALLKKGAKPSCDNYNALHLLTDEMISCNYTEELHVWMPKLTSMLIEAKADVNQKNIRKEEPLETLCKRHEISEFSNARPFIGVVSELLKAGARTDKKMGFGDTVGDYVKSYVGHHPSCAQKTAVLAMLAERAQHAEDDEGTISED
jgi:hypothetical protein